MESGAFDQKGQSFFESTVLTLPPLYGERLLLLMKSSRFFLCSVLHTILFIQQTWRFFKTPNKNQLIFLFFLKTIQKQLCCSQKLLRVYLYTLKNVR